MTEIEKRLLDAIQQVIPLVPRPFQALGDAVGLPEDDVILTIERLVADGLVRRVGAVYDTRLLGYDSTLCAFRIPADRLEEAAEIVSAHPGVSHNYERDHDFNLWFTLAVSPTGSLGLAGAVRLLGGRTGAQRTAMLRALRTFKIGVKFDMAEDRGRRESVQLARREYTPLTARQRDIVRVTQAPLPLVPSPFTGFAHDLELSETALLAALHEFKSRGVLRRVAAILRHRKAGFTANGMSVWKVPPARVEEMGALMASFRAVTHCYERETTPAWEYNVFAMIHGRSNDDVESVIDDIRRESGIDDSAVLYSLREFKKTRVRYFTEEEQRWERENLADSTAGRQEPRV